MRRRETAAREALPTIYNRIRFRSLLEARWAAFFDLMGWPYVYEPCAFNGWIPDFLLRGERAIFVEVKPLGSLRQEPEALAADIDRARCTDECLIVGLGPEVAFEEFRQCTAHLGWLREACPQQTWWWQRAMMGRWIGDESTQKNPHGLMGFCTEFGSFVDRITGCYDGGHHGGGEEEDVGRAVEAAWAEAGNRVQWRPPRK